jgi:soluble lytic murein transglycosylase
MKLCLVPLLALLTVASCSSRESTADGQVAQANDELERAIAADPALRDAVTAIDAGHPWKATVALAPKLSQKKPATLLIAARAAAAWGGWTEVEKLLAGQAWIDSSFNGEAHALLARAALDRGANDEAIRHAEAAVARASAPEKGARQVYLARALDRANQGDSAARTYRAAARNLPLVGEWLVLRAAGAERDADARAEDFERVRIPAAKARVAWTEAQARERFGDIPGAIERYSALGARLTALRLRMAAAGDDGRAAIKDSLVAFLRSGPGRDDTRLAVQIIDSAGVTLTPADQLIIARALSAPGPLPRAVAGFAAAARAGLLRGDDRLQYALALSRSGRNREAIAQLDSIREPAIGNLLGRAAYQRARIVMTSQGASAAIPALRSVADRFTADAENASAALYLLADLSSDAGNDAGAAAAYRELYSKYPRASRADDARFRAAILELVRGNARRAAAGFDSIIALFPNSNERTAAKYWAARALESAGDKAKARSLWEGIITDQPSSYYSIVSARRLKRDAWKPAQVADSFASVPAISAALERIELLEELGMDTEAEFELDALEEGAKGSKDVALATAHAFREHGEGTKAISIALRLIEQGDRDARVYRLAYPIIDREELVRHARANKLDPALVAGLIRQESSFNPHAVSVANARGLMQVLPSVGAEIARALKYPVWSPSLLFDADVNLQLGSSHLAAATRQYDDIVKVLAAYNAGGSRVERWSKKPSASEDAELFAEQIPFVETRDYVRIVQRNAEMYRVLYGLK